MKKMGKRLIIGILTAAMTVGYVTAAEVSDFYDSEQTPVAGTVADSPEENLFSVAGSSDQWIFLDEKEEGIFVLKNAGTETKPFDATKNATKTKFMPGESNNIAFVINSSAFVTKYIPGAMADRMLSATWSVAAGASESAYSVDCKVTLLSAAEYAAYYEKIGAKCGTSGWFLRDPHPTTMGQIVEVSSVTDMAKTMGKLYGVSSLYFNVREIRPALLLEKDFFKKVKLNVETVGANIAAYILKNYKANELSELYSAFELMALGFEHVDLPPSAKDVKMVGEMKIGKPISCTYTYEHLQNVAEGETVITWYVSSTPGGGVTTAGTGSEYYILPAHAGKYLTVEVTPVDVKKAVGTPVRSTSTMGPLPASAGPLANQNPQFADTPVASPAENVFRIKGIPNGFILLERNDGVSFIGTTDNYGSVPFDKKSNVKFDPNSPDNVGYYLNNSLLNGESVGTVLPESIRKFIKRDTVWFTEAGNAQSNAPYDYYTTAAISLLSYQEWQKYYKKFGFDNGYNPIGWWLRSAKGSGDIKDILAVRTNASTDFRGQAFQYGGSFALMVRPVFYITNDFFLNVKLDASTMGSAVKNMMVTNYTLNELSGAKAGYTADELAAIGFSEAPVALKLNVSGIAAVGNEVECAYEYSSSKSKGSSIYRWLIANDEKGSYTPIPSETSKYLTITEDMVGKYIKVSVLPKDISGMGGLEYTSAEGVRITGPQTVNITRARLLSTSGIPATIASPVMLWSTNVGGEAAELTLIVAVYDENNRLLKVQSSDFSFTGGSKDLNFTYVQGANDGAKQIQFVLLDKNKNRPLLLKEVR